MGHGGSQPCYSGTTGRFVNNRRKQPGSVIPISKRDREENKINRSQIRGQVKAPRSSEHNAHAEMGEEKRHQMMQNLFGDQSEEEEEVDSEHESNPQPNYPSDEGEGALEPEGEGEVEGQGEVEIESDAEQRDVNPDPGESEGEREQSSQEVEIGDQREESDGKYTDTDEKEELTSRRRNVIESGSERSEENHYPDNEDDEVNQARSPSGSSWECAGIKHCAYLCFQRQKNLLLASYPLTRRRTILTLHTLLFVMYLVTLMKEEPTDYAVQNDIEHEPNRSPMEEEGSYGKSPRLEDVVADEDARYDSEEDNIEAKPREKPVGPPLELEIPLRPPPAHPEKMNMIKVSNIMGIDPKPFDPKTYVEEDTFVTDESGTKKRIRLENNIVRWRRVRNPDGTTSCESNARFVRWSDGSLQLLIGNEVLDISVQEAQHDQAHLYLRHEKGILQSQGRVLKKMRFMPSSLSSNSHRLLTALVDSRHKKVYKVKNCVTDIDPEREKEEKERAESQTIRANLLLNRKREKVSRKYTPTVDRRRQLSPGFLEDALDEDDEPDYYESRHSRRHIEEDLEMEARAEKRILNAKKGTKDIPRKSSLPTAKSSRRSMDFSDSERGESEYETDGEEDEISPPRKRAEDPEPEYEDEEEEEEEEHEEAEVNEASDEEAEEPKQKARESGHSHKRKEIESDEDSPPRKAAPHRRMAVVYDSDED
ncbi:protein LEO1 homolog isoform X1 [Prunus yedoensis var. nudiflora]|uniref:Protein LEO1 homolog isoform X1 n=1 Tax=Prunus yedoensis var. nudiflora TaxID=2094558 RepID=A0A314XTB8_PRUYE|nr:protein LEO1 homolog isoform X1 [Prunus yedoensis var. nudiflora]